MGDIEKRLPNLKKDVPLSGHTTFRIGGKAKYFIEVKSKEEIERVVAVARERGLSFLILGNGSNILVSDEGYDGIVIKMSGRKITLKEEIVSAESGVLLPFLSLFCAKSGLAGLEWASGIPGTVGGAIRGNAGAFDASMADIVAEVAALDARSGRTLVIKNKECGFGYRESLFKKNPELIIIKAKLKFTKENPEKVQAQAKRYLNYRKERHPGEPSAGCIFEALKLSEKEKAKISQGLPEIKKFSDAVPAAFLIEQCGLKGKRLGDAMVSELHANFVINLGKAKADDVKRLISLIKAKVKGEFGVSLKEEIEYISF